MYNFLSNKYKKIEIEIFKDRLIHLKVITKEIDKINITESLETEKIEEIAKKRAKRIRNKK